MSALLYLFSFAVLATTDFVSGVHVVLTLLLLGLYAQLREKYVLSGILFGLAGLAKLYAFVPIIALLLVLVRQREWQVLFYSGVSVVVVFGAVMLGFWIWIGHDFYAMIIASHLGSIKGLSRSGIFSFFAKHDMFLVFAVLPLLYIRKRVPAFIIIPAGVLLVFFVFFQDLYYLYFKMLVVWLAMWWGWNVSQHRLLHRFVINGVIVLVLGVSVWRYTDEQADVVVVDRLDDIAQNDEVLYGDFSIVPTNQVIW